MFKIILISILICISCVYSSAQVKDSLNQIDKNGLKQGRWIKKDEKGKTVYEGTFLNDKPFGKFIYYYSNGKKKSTTTFYRGNQAFTRFFNTEGQLMVEGKVIGELKDSTCKYYENDSLTSLENYLLGKRNGHFATYFKNGKILEEANYKNDILEGPYKQYFESGILKSEYAYIKGFRDGAAKFYYPSGQPSVEGKYIRDFKEGTWNYYGESGVLDWQVVYKKSNPTKSKRYNGIEDDYYPSKIPKSKITFKNGLKNGAFTEFYDIGEIKQETVPSKDGSPEDVKEVITGQKVKRQGNYLNDKLDGKVTYYKEDGTIEKEETYKVGELLK